MINKGERFLKVNTNLHTLLLLVLVLNLYVILFSIFSMMGS